MTAKFECSDKASINWERIENFIGYGASNAPVVFIGMEEGGPSDEQLLLNNLLHRSSYEQLVTLGSEWNKIQRTWRVMCEIMLARSGIKAITNFDRLEYQRKKLGKENGESLLSELMPYPARSASVWPNLYRDRFPTRIEYFNYFLPKRIQLLKEFLYSEKRELIIFYGKSHWRHYCSIVDIKFDKFLKKDFEIRDVGSMRIVFCHHFVARYFNSFNSDESREFFSDCVLSRPPIQ